MGPGWGPNKGDQLLPALLTAPSRGRTSTARVPVRVSGVRVTPLGQKGSPEKHGVSAELLKNSRETLEPQGC